MMDTVVFELGGGRAGSSLVEELMKILPVTVVRYRGHYEVR